MSTKSFTKVMTPYRIEGTRKKNVVHKAKTKKNGFSSLDVFKMYGRCDAAAPALAFLASKRQSFKIGKSTYKKDAKGVLHEYYKGKEVGNFNFVSYRNFVRSYLGSLLAE